MPHLTSPLANGGSIIPLLVGATKDRLEALKKAGRALPSPQTAIAMIDTGASSTVIDPSVLAPLGLAATGSMSIHTPSTGGKAMQCDQYDVALVISHSTKPSMVVDPIPVIATALSSQGITALIGRDLLASCLFVFDGATGTFTLAW